VTPLDFLTSYAARPMAWGAIDCCLMLADWCIANGWPDPARELRGTYDSEDACAALVARSGGLVPLATPRFDAIGLARAETVADGVIGIVGSPRAAERQWGALYCDGRWWVRVEAGVAPVISRAIVKWEVPRCP
jgi:hypothetical protein